MGITQDHALGRRQKFFVTYESSAGTFEKPVSASAVKMLNTSIAREKELKVRDDSRTHRSALERIEGRSSVPWSCDGYIIPSGTAGTPPDMHDLLYAAMGGYTNTPATSDAYSLASTQTLRTLSLTRHYNNVYMESCWLAVVNSMTINAAGGAEPTIAFDGMAGGFAVTGTSTLDGAMSATDQMQVQAADTRNFNVNSVVACGSDDNSSAGYKITAVNHTTYTHTLEANCTASNSDAVIPFAPAETTVGSPINGISGSVTFGGVSLPITSFDLTLTNNLKMTDDQVATEYPDDAIPGWREVTGNISFRARKDHVILFNNRDILSTRAVTIVLGATAGSICTISIPTMELDFSGVEVPTAEEAVFNVPYVAMGSSGNDELTVTFT